MTTLSQILDRIDAVLRASVPSGTTVYRDRVDAQSLQEASSVNVLAQDAQAQAFSDDFDFHDVDIDMEIYVRADDPTPAAEAIHGAFHPQIVGDSQLKALAQSIRFVEARFDRSESDTTSLVKAARYRFRYLIPSISL